MWTRGSTLISLYLGDVLARPLNTILNLIVNGTPLYNYRAKSMPKLIVERLTTSSDGSKRQFYLKLLAKFKTNN